MALALNLLGASLIVGAINVCICLGGVSGLYSRISQAFDYRMRTVLLVTGAAQAALFGAAIWASIAA